MSRHTLAAFLIALAFFGIADSWYLAQSALMNTSLTCNISGLEGCNIVAQSAYSHFFGVPLGVYGVVFYGIIFVLAALLYILPKRFVYIVLAALGTIGIVASLIFVLVQILLIKALCVYCLGSAVIAFLIFVIALWLHNRHAPPRIVTVPGL
ncbi:MAG: vitamin K epoxide reductase family protein [Candidatus Pacebacteria bacterium]|nr:vitamin K epoxide reductase family protein [Candidatus Paceibacterota bacterium]